jgi:DDHD domain
MTSTDPKSSLLGTISPWNISRGTTPRPKEDNADNKQIQEQLRKSRGQDHTHSNRPLPSPRRYPPDCPPLNPRWFYAVDVPKRKPLPVEQITDEKEKPAQAPKKFTAFSASDSISIETAFQRLADGDTSERDVGFSANTKLTRVPVNEDYLFDVVIEKRELEPAYWLGPVYEVRRGSWFYPEGSSLRPCEENLANQLEEGYLKIAPWRQDVRGSTRSSSQPRPRPSSVVIGHAKQSSGGSEGTSPVLGGSPNLLAADSYKPDSAPNSYRLFGTHMNTTVSYQDKTTAWLASDDFMSRMSSTLAGYSRFAGFSGTRVVRGYAQTSGTKTTEAPKLSEVDSVAAKRKSALLETPLKADDNKEQEDAQEEEAAVAPKRSALERQLSSLAGAPANESSEDLAEEARQEEEKEMEDYKETDGEDQGRAIEHLVLVTHGIGQRLGLRLDSINFIHDVNTLRKTMKAVYSYSPDLQVLNQQQFQDAHNNSRVMCLPIVWRHLLDFPKQSLRQNKQEFDLADAGSIDEDDYPSLSDITVDGVPSVRNLITDLAMDVLLYQSAYREHIAGIVQRECNRVCKLFKERNPAFSGRVSLCGHSLGSAIIFDILCRQKETGITRLRHPRKTSTEVDREKGNLQLDFNCENFFALGSPIALFQMLKGRTIAARHHNEESKPAQSPFDPDPMDTFARDSQFTHQDKNIIPISVSSPKCDQLFNIFHPTDPISYRIEPLISPAMASLKPQLLPYTKKGLFGAPGIANIGARVGQSVGSLWYNFTSGVASSLLNRSLGITGEEQALSQDNKFQGNLDKKSQQQIQPGSQMPIADNKRQQALAEATLSKPASDQQGADHLPTLIDAELETLYAGFQKRRLSQQPSSPNPLESEFDEAEEKAKKLKREEAKVRALNGNGRVDYSIQEGTFDISLLASIASHLSYWADEDVNHFMLGQMLSRSRKEE